MAKNNPDDEESLRIINNWRAAHSYPLHVFYFNFKLRTKDKDDIIVVRRLKRMSSIVSKLTKETKMNLWEMQDLGGCRIIVPTLEEVYALIENYKKSQIKHILKKENDYILNPKQSGYRSYHLVYQFKTSISTDKQNFNNHFLIEIQVRTKLQHYWATAVESYGAIVNQALKSSKGNREYLDFFRHVSALFCLIEQTPTIPGITMNEAELVSKIKEMDEKHRIINTLKTYKIEISKNKTGKFYLISLDINTGQSNLTGYRNLESALKDYEKNEESKIDSVLISANTFDNIQKAFPNYFLDLSGFVSVLETYFAKYK